VVSDNGFCSIKQLELYFAYSFPVFNRELRVFFCRSLFITSDHCLIRVSFDIITSLILARVNITGLKVKTLQRIKKNWQIPADFQLLLYLSDIKHWNK
jgi:hypothetical protein